MGTKDGHSLVVDGGFNLLQFIVYGAIIRKKL